MSNPFKTDKRAFATEVGDFVMLVLLFGTIVALCVVFDQPS